ncbi:putative UDP-glucose lipid carrier transferase [Candidatus Nanopelagicaceae bacterium]
MSTELQNSFIFKRKFLNYLIAFESILLIVLTGLAVQVREIGEEVNPGVDWKVFLLLVAFPMIWLCSLSLFGAWDIQILDNHIDGYRRLMKSSFMTFLAFCSASYLFRIQISRFVILFSLFGGTLLHLLLRWIFLRIIDKKLVEHNHSQNWLTLTHGNHISREVQEFAHLKSANLKHFPFKIENFASWVHEVISKIHTDQISRLILADVSALSPIQIQQLMWSVHQTNAEFVAFDSLGLASAQNQLKYHDGLNWVTVGESKINESLRVIKRLFDLVIVIPAILLLTPVFVVIACLVKLDSKGKVLFTQKRIGQNGKLFTFPKFRSMKDGSETLRLDIVGRPNEGMADRYRSDPRITRVGRVIRRFSLDELPQLWCVLRGTMSLVGPRPILPEEEPQLGDFHFRRHIAKPGLTGIWQVSGRKETSWEDRMAFDIKYVEEWSVALDLILITRTFRAIVSGEGSY